MLSREVTFETKRTDNNVLTIVPTRSTMDPVGSQWEKIVQFIDGAMEYTGPTVGYESRINFTKNKIFLKQCILTGVQTGEFDPQHPIDTVAGMIAVFAEGCKSLGEEIISLEKQVELIKAQLKEILLVL